MLALSHKRPYVSLQRQMHSYPLHSAVENGDVQKVAKILKTDLIPVNSKNHRGEFPLCIAERKSYQEGYPYKIYGLLLDYGACYLYDTTLRIKDTKEYTAEFKAKVAYESLSSDQSVRELALKHLVGEWELVKWRYQLRENFTSLFADTKWYHFKEYTAEFKAKVAYESLSSDLSVRELALKHGVKEWEIVKWRYESMEKLTSIFNENKS